MHPDFALVSFNLGRLHRETGDLARARAELDEAIEIRDRVLGPEHPQTLETRVERARVMRADGELATALAQLDEIVTKMAEVGADPLALAAARFEYAQVAWEHAGPGALAHARAREARATFLADGAPSRTALDEVDAWLREHPMAGQ
jgi:tetratricopeptide (TPR) repeat protein